MARLEGETDAVVKERLTAALASLDEQRKQRDELLVAAKRLEAEHTRLFFELQRLHTQILRVKAADAGAAEVAGAGLKSALEQLAREIDAVADSLTESGRRDEQGSRPDRGPGTDTCPGPRADPVAGARGTQGAEARWPPACPALAPRPSRQAAEGSARGVTERPVDSSAARPLSSPLGFELTAVDPTGARTGVLHTRRGAVKTPVFMSVATHAVLRNASLDDARVVEAPIVLGNTFHLMLRPGAEVFRRFGGIHGFMQWDGPVLTDSGGFQIFSLAKDIENLREGRPLPEHLRQQPPAALARVVDRDAAGHRLGHHDGARRLHRLDHRRARHPRRDGAHPPLGAAQPRGEEPEAERAGAVRDRPGRRAPPPPRREREVPHPASRSTGSRSAASRSARRGRSARRPRSG